MLVFWLSTYVHSALLYDARFAEEFVSTDVYRQLIKKSVTNAWKASFFFVKRGSLVFWKTWRQVLSLSKARIKCLPLRGFSLIKWPLNEGNRIFSDNKKSTELALFGMGLWTQNWFGEHFIWSIYLPVGHLWGLFILFLLSNNLLTAIETLDVPHGGMFADFAFVGVNWFPTRLAFRGFHFKLKITANFDKLICF